MDAFTISSPKLRRDGDLEWDIYQLILHDGYMVHVMLLIDSHVIVIVTFVCLFVHHGRSAEVISPRGKNWYISRQSELGASDSHTIIENEEFKFEVSSSICSP